MKRCPVCGADLLLHRRRNTYALIRWRAKNRKRYNDYQREYQRKYRARKREARANDHRPQWPRQSLRMLYLWPYIARRGRACVYWYN